VLVGCLFITGMYVLFVAQVEKVFVAFHVLGEI
jgi:hypothetical protein